MQYQRQNVIVDPPRATDRELESCSLSVEPLLEPLSHLLRLRIASISLVDFEADYSSYVSRDLI